MYNIYDLDGIHHVESIWIVSFQLMLPKGLSVLADLNVACVDLFNGCDAHVCDIVVLRVEVVGYQNVFLSFDCGTVVGKSCP